MKTKSAIGMLLLILALIYVKWGSIEAVADQSTTGGDSRLDTQQVGWLKWEISEDRSGEIPASGDGRPVDRWCHLARGISCWKTACIENYIVAMPQADSSTM